MKKALSLLLTLTLVISLFVFTGSAFAKTTKGELYYNGEIMRTVVVPAKLPHGGRDPLYRVTNGVMDQLGVASVAPGSQNYHGGAWAVYEVTFNVAPYLLTSEADVLAAEAAGDVTVVRQEDQDFRCPIFP